jgi:hypothetical protein
MGMAESVTRWMKGCHLPGGRVQSHGGFRHENALQFHVMGSGTAHAEHPPGILDEESLGGERHREVADGRAGLGIVVDAHGGEEVGGGDAAREDLAPGHAVAALDLHQRAGAADPIRSARGGEDEIFGRHAPEERFRGLVPRAPTEGLGRDVVRMHRERQRGRTAMPRDLADDGA